MRALIAIVALSLSLAGAPRAEAADRRVPGFRPVDAEKGVVLWRKNKEYVQQVSLRDGASIRLLHGAMIPSDGPGTNFARRDLRDWWTEWRNEEDTAYALLNAQFFNMQNDRKSPLAFSTKMDGIVYVGYGDETEYPGRKLVLRIGGESAAMEPYDDDPGSLYAVPEEHVIVGLKPDVSKTGNIRRGRTFIGMTGDGKVLIFTSPAATQRYAYRILAAFGAERTKIMMLDGGGSTQFIHEGKLLIPTTKNGTASYLRTVPLAIGVTRGE